MICLPRDTVQPMEAALRNSNEIICKHRKLPLQVPGKVFRESGRGIRKFYGRYGDLIKQYEVSLSRMLHDILDDDHLQ